MIKGATFSDCGKYRYTLWRIWTPDKPLVMCIGLNPSTANADDNDNTIDILVSALMALNYGGFYMTNLFALITPKPDELRACPDPLKENDKWLADIKTRCAEIIFCWGNFKQAEYRAKKIKQLIPRAKCFGKNKNGTPWHPRAIPYAGIKYDQATLIDY